MFWSFTFLPDEPPVPFPPPLPTPTALPFPWSTRRACQRKGVTLVLLPVPGSPAVLSNLRLQCCRQPPERTPPPGAHQHCTAPIGQGCEVWDQPTRSELELT